MEFQKLFSHFCSFVGQITMHDWFTLACSLLSGSLGAIAVMYYSNYREMKICRNVAYAVVYSLQQEIENSLKLVEQTRIGQQACVGPLPTKAWYSLQALLSDRHILDAIIRFGKKGQVTDQRIGTTFGDERFEAYRIEEVLSHLKNHFCNIVPQLTKITTQDFQNPSRIAQLYVGSTNVNLTLKKILDGLS